VTCAEAALEESSENVDLLSAAGISRAAFRSRRDLRGSRGEVPYSCTPGTSRAPLATLLDPGSPWVAMRHKVPGGVSMAHSGVDRSEGDAQVAYRSPSSTSFRFTIRLRAQASARGTSVMEATTIQNDHRATAKATPSGWREP